MTEAEQRYQDACAADRDHPSAQTFAVVLAAAREVYRERHGR